MTNKNLQSVLLAKDFLEDIEDFLSKSSIIETNAAIESSAIKTRSKTYSKIASNMGRSSTETQFYSCTDTTFESTLSKISNETVIFLNSQLEESIGIFNKDFLAKLNCFPKEKGLDKLSGSLKHA